MLKVNDVYEEMDDKTLVSEAQAGADLAFSELVRRQQKGLTRFILKMTRDLSFTEDVVQDTLIKAFTKIKSFRGQSSFKSWLYKIGLNTAKNKLRSQKSGQLNIDNIHLSQNSDIENNIYLTSLKTLIQQAIERLPQKQKEAIYLRIFEDLSFKEIAELMESPYDTAKANYRHGLMKLKNGVLNNDIYREWKDLLVDKKLFKKIDF